MPAAFSVHLGDITRLDVDAIVNAANESLLGGGGVDGAIHRAAGQRLLAACRALPEVRHGVRCPVGEVRLTPGFDLPARHVIHTVGPVWRGGHSGEDDALISCYRSAAALAEQMSLHSLACPAVSCGIYGFPPDRGTRLAVQTIRRRLALVHDRIDVVLVGFNQTMAAHWRTAVDDDPANGWDAVADAVVEGRDATTIGAAVVREWAATLRPGATVLDLGCGGGVPVSRTLVDAGHVVSGVDASPRMVAAYRARFPDARIACESAEACTFFGGAFDAVVSIGLLFLLDEDAQRSVIRRVSQALAPGGRFLFTAPWQIGAWRDHSTGRESISLGREAYSAALASVGLQLVGTFEDEGGNHYYSTQKPPLVGRRDAMSGIE